mgnify:FL=1
MRASEDSTFNAGMDVAFWMCALCIEYRHFEPRERLQKWNGLSFEGGFPVQHDGQRSDRIAGNGGWRLQDEKTLAVRADVVWLESHQMEKVKVLGIK